MSKLIHCSLKPSTLKAYKRSMSIYNEFVKNKLEQHPVFPVSEKNVGLFITHLFQIGLQYSTIQGHVTALGYFHKIYSHSDPTQNFFITKLMQGISKQLPAQDHRRPIDKKVLVSLLSVLPQCAKSNYLSSMFASMFTLSYNVCLRVGEIACSNNRDNVIQLDQLSCVTKGVSTVAYLLKFEDFKHSTDKPTMRINEQKDTGICPVLSLTSYLKLRGSVEGPLYIFQDKSTVRRQHFANILEKCLTQAGYNKKDFGTHSFRIGRCTDMANEGFSDAQIKLVGRWKSDAFKRYIRPAVTQL